MIMRSNGLVHSSSDRPETGPSMRATVNQLLSMTTAGRASAEGMARLSNRNRRSAKSRCSAKDDPRCSSQHVEGRMRRSVEGGLLCALRRPSTESPRGWRHREDDAPNPPTFPGARPQQNMTFAVKPRAHPDSPPPQSREIESDPSRAITLRSASASASASPRQLLGRETSSVRPASYRGSSGGPPWHRQAKTRRS